MRTVGSLFTGYGGLDLAVLAHYDARLAWWSELDPNAAAIHERHTDAPNLGDITRIDWTTVEPVDIIAGGFPCQDLSYAGRGAGLDGDRSGLWWRMFDAVSVLRPDRVVIENVGALRTRGLDAVTHALAQIGYVGSWTTLRASDVDACHQRERIFLVAQPADPDGPGLERAKR
jgi:DNA (cytosine-5)-methyltransferase 1